MLKKISLSLLVFAIAFSVSPVFAETAAVTTTANTSVDTSSDVILSDVSLNGESESEVNSASEETSEIVTFSGMLVEIGNTTAEETTLIIRPNPGSSFEGDQTIEINADTRVHKDNSTTGDLSDWIAGDQITVTAEYFSNSGALVATKIRNRAFKQWHKGRNGWIKEIRADAQEVDVEWAGKIYTLDVADAKMVAGNINPAAITDLEVGDRVRARVLEDGDGNNLTWDAKILVVLRRGDTLFMRVTRWVVPGVITSIPEELDLPVTIEVEVSESKFYEEGDVNNLIGAPGTLIMVDITEDTKLRRRYLGKASLHEFSEGDHVRVIGRRNESTGHLDAKFIKDNSIQRLGVAHRLGKVTAVDSSNQSLTVDLRGTNRVHKQWIINTDGETEYKMRGVDEVAFEDIEVGDIIRVRGTANRVDHTVAADVVAVITHKRLEPNGDSEFTRPKDKIQAKIQKAKDRMQQLRDKIQARKDTVSAN